MHADQLDDTITIVLIWAINFHYCEGMLFGYCFDSVWRNLNIYYHVKELIKMINIILRPIYI